MFELNCCVAVDSIHSRVTVGSFYDATIGYSTMKKHLRTLSVIAVVLATAIHCNAAVVTNTVSLAEIMGSDTNPAGDMASVPLSFLDPMSGSTINYNLEVLLDWVDASGTTVTGVTGELFVGFGSTLLGANSQAGLGASDTGSVEEVSLKDGGTAFERLTFSVSGLTGANFVGFDNPTGPNGGATGSMSNAQFAGLGTDFLTAAATSNGGFRLATLDLSFDTGTGPQAVPEPGTWIMFGVLGLLLGYRARQSAIRPTMAE